MGSEVKRDLYHSIVTFLAKECSCTDYNADTIESLEVAKQCLESAFLVSGDETSKYDLLSVLKRNSEPAPNSTPAPFQPTDEDKMMAENLKMQGNACMSAEQFNEAIACYTKAIEKDPFNAVYFCNRAAAYGRLNKHDECLADCERAISIDPSYSKSFGRMGLAYSSKRDYKEAIECYKKALALDPNNSNFKTNLEIAEANLKAEPPTGADAGASAIPGLDLNALLNNPMLHNMYQTFMSNPSLRGSMESMMQGMFRGATENTTPESTATDGSAPTANQAPPIDNLLRMGQQLAQQMQQMNPDLVSTLRSQMENVASSVNPNNSNPPSSDEPANK